MSGPVTPADAPPEPVVDVPPGPELEVTPSREAVVGESTVRRALPRRGRRTVGAWCFVDHFGPAEVAMAIGPHPHIGLHTVTWLLDGEAVHHDSLGSAQRLRPGQLNLMTAGRGIAHAEEGDERTGPPPLTHGAQLWVAQAEATRHGPPAFEHHAELPQVDLGGAVATVLVGSLDGATSPARADTPLLGTDLRITGRAVVPLDRSHEHALVVLDGAVTVGGTTIEPGSLAYLGLGRDELVVDAAVPTRALLLGGAPFPEPVLMWWNFVARTREEIDAARAAWQQPDDERFAPVASALGRVPAPGTPWSSA